MSIEIIKVPDIGDYKNADVVEVNVAKGDIVLVESPLITLETDKASMEVPSPVSGKIIEVITKVGDKVSEGSVIMKIAVNLSNTTKEENFDEKIQFTNSTIDIIDINVPDIGDYKNADVVEVNVAKGDIVLAESPLITLETDKASMEVPSPVSGKIIEVITKVGDKVSEGSLILRVQTKKNDPVLESTNLYTKETSQPFSSQVESPSITQYNIEESIADNSNTQASPAVRKLAIILNVSLNKVKATGRKGRVTKEDCYKYIKNAVTQVQNGRVTKSDSSLDILDDPIIDFSKFGAIEAQTLTRINKMSAKNLHRNWVKIPHVTFYDYADVTDLEKFRKSKKGLLEKNCVKITILSFLVKALAVALQEFPRMNSSLSNDGQNLIIKKYYNIAFAVDTPLGLMVPVIKNVDKKGIIEIATKIMKLSDKARNGNLNTKDISGATFSISSIGVLGTTSFTPIINMPEVAIMGVSKTVVKPIWNGKKFQPKIILPLSMSADHRVVDGALAAKFLTRYSQILSDVREIIM